MLSKKLQGSFNVSVEWELYPRLQLHSEPPRPAGSGARFSVEGTLTKPGGRLARRCNGSLDAGAASSPHFSQMHPCSTPF